MLLFANDIEMHGLLFVENLIQAIPESGPAKVLSAYIKSRLHNFPPKVPTHSDMNEDEKQETIPILSEELLADMMVRHFSFFLMVEWI